MRSKAVASLLAVAVVAASAQAALIDLSLESLQTAPIHAGETVTVELWARSTPSGEELTSVQAYIQYDDTLLLLVDDLGGVTEAIIPGPMFPTPIHNEVLHDGLGGAVFFSAGADLDPTVPVPTTDALVASMHFMAIQDFSDTWVTLNLERELRNGGTLACRTRALNWIEDVTGAAIAANIVGDLADQLVADPGGPYALTPGQSVVLDGTQSAQQGAITEYLWEMLGQPVYQGPDPVIELAWADLEAVGVSAVGNYEVTLTVYDAAGGMDTMSTTLAVLPEPLSLLLLGSGAGLLAWRRRKSAG